MRTFTCSVAQPGFYAGPVYFIQNEDTEEKKADDPVSELLRLQRAMEDLRQSIKEKQTSGKNAAIRETVLFFLEDDEFASQAEQYIRSKLFDAATAVWKAAEDIAAELDKAGSEYNRSRQEDIRGLAAKLISVLQENNDELSEFSAVCAKEISPAQLSSIPDDMLGGILTEKGNPNSHTSIMAGNLGIPFLYGNAEAVEEAKSASFIVLDSEKSTVIIDPDEITRKEAEKHMAEERVKQALAKAEDGECPVLCRTKIYANIEGPQDIEALLSSGADGVGLFRTEFLFLDRDTAPEEEEQYEAYKAVLEAMGEKSVYIRTMDLGSDKKVSWLEFPEESNPALGMRGARVSLEHKELLRTQLRALLRAGVYGNLKLMFPMIASVWEIDELLEEFQNTVNELESEGISFKIPGVGIMVEAPAAAICAEELAQKVDFFSIGTNDLTQYTLALDREANGLDRYFNAHHEAIYRLVQMTVEGGHKKGITTGICGQLAADPEAVERLIRIGVHELSVPTGKVKATKKLAATAEKNIEGKAN